MNESDSERLATFLEARGYKPAQNPESAKLIVVNACSVRQPAIDRVYGKINQFLDKKIIVAGCVLESDKKKLSKYKNVTFWHPNDYFNIPPIRSNKFTAFVPIMTGCNNFCSYCAVPFTRGREKSRPAHKIICEVRALINDGYKEILLIGQNVNSYKSQKINFAKLLKAINDLTGDFRLAFLTSHPKDMSDELIEILANCQKLKKELHLPVQSGDDEILRKMNRHYTVAHYKNLVKKIREAIPVIKISTDIIIGFPGETKKQFQNTMRFCKQINFDKAYIAKYSPRPGTAAARLKDNVSAAEKTRRWRILDTLINKFEH